MMLDVSETKSNHIGIKNATFILGFFATYGFVMSFPLLLVGSFSGPVLLFAGFLHLLMGGLSLLARYYLFKRSKSGRLLSILISVAITAAAVLMIQYIIINKEDLFQICFPAMFLILAVSLVVVLFKRNVSNYFK